MQENYLKRLTLQRVKFFVWQSSKDDLNMQHYLKLVRTTITIMKKITNESIECFVLDKILEIRDDQTQMKSNVP